jgi:hypothetical protein
MATVEPRASLSAATLISVSGWGGTSHVWTGFRGPWPRMSTNSARMRFSMTSGSKSPTATMAMFSGRYQSR